MKYPVEIVLNLASKTVDALDDRPIDLKETPIIIAVMKDQEEAERLTQ